MDVQIFFVKYCVALTWQNYFSLPPKSGLNTHSQNIENIALNENYQLKVRPAVQQEPPWFGNIFDLFFLKNEFTIGTLFNKKNMLFTPTPA